jgi:hypothetical protein
LTAVLLGALRITACETSYCFEMCEIETSAS